MIERISVIGAGTMGHGVAMTFALAGYGVKLYEASEAVRASVPGRIHDGFSFLLDEGFIQKQQMDGAISRILICDDLGTAVGDAEFVLECVSEDIAVKKRLFASLDALCPSYSVIASNTSSLSLSEITSELSDARKAMTMMCHWYNPPFLIPIAELSFFGNMDERIFDEVYKLHIRAGKQPIKVLKDIPGLVANRILHAMAREVFHLMEIGAATAEDIDKALKFGPGFRAATTGLLETADMGGLDIWCAAEDNLLKELDNSAAACDYLRESVNSGRLGVKSGEGFFSYPGDTKTAVVNAFNKRLLTQLKASKTYQTP
ncbi:MAG: 3-hydroxyacyl-CoA dehydrogenase family protein [Oscillospiraceae bacterium]|jgi:3-hydroxybutyryl-CoA dehydrogenase|nr:3-hydroxyacyl-CoA dehydrogenase family protein [Oscillospiraceae bacterium]